MNHFGIFFTALLLAGPGLLAQDENPREAAGQATAKQAASSLRGGDYESAREDFSFLLKVFPADEGLARGLARAWAATGGYEKARDVLKAAPKWDSAAKLQAAAGRGEGFGHFPPGGCWVSSPRRGGLCDGGLAAAARAACSTEEEEE